MVTKERKNFLLGVTYLCCHLELYVVKTDSYTCDFGKGGREGAVACTNFSRVAWDAPPPKEMKKKEGGGEIKVLKEELRKLGTQ